MLVCETLHDMGVPARQLHPLAGGRQCDIGGVRVFAFPSRHVRFDLTLIWRTLRRVLRFGRKTLALLRRASAWPQGDVLGYQFVVSEKSVVHLGSAGWHRDELARLRPDVVLLPLQGHSNIHRVALDMVELLRPKCVIPHHHDDFCPPLSEAIPVRPFVDLVHKRVPGIKVVEPKIGEWMPLFDSFCM
jgi:L-ascorbate metabolism protein UlaG (beta-lactamase superfamily)